MPSLRSGKLYPRFIALFLLMVIISSVVLAGVTWYFSLQTEESLRSRIEDNIEIVGNRFTSDMVTLFDLCGLVAKNSVIQENFRPYETLTIGQKYYYNDIINLLWQTRLQFNGLIESVFLYADGERVLYSANENGMANCDTFFSRIVLYEKRNSEDWLSLLNSKAEGFTVLSGDRYSTFYVNDSHAVIPIIYRFINHGYANVLVMNISLAKVCALYESNTVLEQSSFAVYDENKDLLFGDNRFGSGYDEAGRVFIQNEKYVTCASSQQMLGISIVCFTPRSALLNMISYYKYLIFILPLIFVLFGTALAIVLSKKMYEPFRIVHESMPQSENDEYFQSELESIKNSIKSLADDRKTYINKSREHLDHYVSQTLANLLNNNSLDNEAYFAQAMADEYGFVTSSCRVVNVLIDVSVPSGYLTIHEAMKRFAQIIEEVFSNHIPYVRIRFEENMYVLVLSESEPSENKILSLCEKLQMRVDEVTGSTTSVRYGIGNVVMHYSDLPESFEVANSAIFSISTAEGWADTISPKEFHYEQREIINALSSCDIRLVEETCGEILNSAKQGGITYGQACSILRDIYSTAVTVYNKLSPGHLAPTQPVNYMSVLILSPEINTSALISALLPYIPSILQNRNDEGMERIAKKIKAFIDKNYMQELSLDILADHLNLSSKYISRVFKISMNVNLSDYLAYVRMEKAKELLLTEEPLEKITEQVGITNRTTFTRTFRKFEGVTPSEWRRAHRDAQVYNHNENK